ncbi:MAG: hypothetical protein DRJ05_02955 [Bacteroidetes bacterium]|nr:MAG: hypothetical protein DRJ05_02955 [Bacteroidota bacterium]
MKIKLIFVLSFFIVGSLFAQEKIGDNVVYTDAEQKYQTTGQHGSDDTSSFFSKGFNPEQVEKAIKENPFKVNVEIGTSFGTNFGGGNYFGSYVAPEVSYQLAPRFTVSGGAMLTSGFPMGSSEPYYYGAPGLLSGSVNRTFVYAKGAYQVSENLRITGAVYKEVNVFNSQLQNYPGANFDYEGVIMGVDYQIGKNMFIHGEVEFSNGANPSRFHPNQFPSNGFAPSPFNRMNNGPF